MSARMSSIKSQQLALAKLIDNRLTLQRGISAQLKMDQEEELEEQLMRCQLTPGRGPNPPQIYGLPPELWGLIFGYLKLETLWSCYGVCQEFKELLEPQSPLWLIEKVLPILVQGKYLTLPDLLAMRSTCKFWQRLITNFLESDKSWLPSSSSSSGVIINKTVPLLSYRLLDRRTTTPQILAHPRNPLVTRSVVLDATRLSVFCNLFGVLCTHVWYIRLQIDEKNSPVNDSDVMNWCVGYFPNLKSLRISTKGLVSRNMNRNRSLSRFRNEETLKTVMPAVCSKLESVRLRSWSDNWSNYQWNQLKTLKIGTKDASVFSTLKALYRLKAPNLETLGIRMTSPSGNKAVLQLLLQTINKFSKLKELLLEADQQLEITEKEIETTSVNLPDVCSISLETLDLKTGILDKLTYSLLIYFPFLKHLYISYGVRNLDRDEDYDDFGFVGNISSRNYRNRKLYEMTREQQAREMMDLRTYLYLEDRSGFKQSNLWKVLLFLQDVEIKDYWKSFGEQIETKEKFSRN